MPELVTYHERKAFQTQQLYQEDLFPGIYYRDHKYYDWAITLRFYYVLHWVTAYLQYVLEDAGEFEPDEYNCKTHEKTAEALSDPKRRKFHKLDYRFINRYKELYNLSRDARYECAYERVTIPEEQSELEYADGLVRNIMDDEKMKAFKQKVEAEIKKRSEVKISKGPTEG